MTTHTRLAAILVGVLAVLAPAVCQPATAATPGPQVRTVVGADGVSRICTYDWKNSANRSSIDVKVAVSQHYRTPVDLDCFRNDFLLDPSAVGYVGAAGLYVGWKYCAWVKPLPVYGTPNDYRAAVIAGPRWIPTNYFPSSASGIAIEVGRRTIYDAAGNVTGCKAT